jgi:hypothetical protein
VRGAGREGRRDCRYDASVSKMDLYQAQGDLEVYLVSCRRKGRRMWGRVSRDRLRACQRFDSHTA